MSAGPRVLLLQLAERTSGRGTKYMSGWLGRASVVAFEAEEPDRYGNKCWNVYVSEPQPRAEAGQERDQARRPQARQADGTGEVRSRPEPSSGSAGTAAPNAPAKPSAPPGARGDGWRGSQYRRPANGAGRVPAGDDAPFYEDSLEDVGR